MPKAPSPITNLGAYPGKRWFNNTTQSKHNLPVAENHLNQKFQAAAPNQKWASDLIYVWTWEGWLYLAVILDVYSRVVVGWAMSHGMTDELTLDAPKGPSKGENLLSKPAIPL